MNDEFKAGDRVRYTTVPLGQNGAVLALTDYGGVLVAWDDRPANPTRVNRLHLEIVSRPVYLTAEQRTCLLGCICAAESDGYHDDQIAAAYDALDATPEER